MRLAKYIPGIVVMAVMLLLTAAPVVLQLRIIWWKHQAEERLERASLRTVHVSTKNIRWEEEGKELRIGHRLFDVESYRETDQELIATGIFDDEETGIEEKAEAFWEKAAPQQSGFLVKYFQLLNGTCLLQNTWQLHALPFSGNKYTDTLFIPIKIVYLSIPSPPPQEGGHIFAI